MMKEIANTKTDIAKLKREVKDKEGTIILNITTTAAAETAKITETIATSNIAYEKLKSFNDIISGINDNIDKRVEKMKILYNQSFDNLCLDIEDRTQDAKQEYNTYITARETKCSPDHDIQEWLAIE